jgi:nickel-dependent lactate racemase
LPSGGELVVNKLAVEADLLVSEGFIEPHFFAGFSGGRKSVLPGIAARETVLANHCSEFIRSPYSRTGNLAGNPIHEDMVFAGKTAKLAFIVNVIINHEKKIIRAFAGDMEKAHETGCEYLKDKCRVDVPPADIVITSNGGYPLDQNVYQSVKGMTAGEAVCKEGGVIILSASCCDGHGGEAFCKVLSDAASPRELWDRLLAIPRNQTSPDQWQYQILARILKRFTVILVTNDCDHQMINAMGIKCASSPDEALAMAMEKLGRDASVAIIPDGVSIIPTLA